MHVRTALAELGLVEPVTVGLAEPVMVEPVVALGPAAMVVLAAAVPDVMVLYPVVLDVAVLGSDVRIPQAGWAGAVRKAGVAEMAEPVEVRALVD